MEVKIVRYDNSHLAVLRFSVNAVLPNRDNLQLIGPLSFLRPPNIEQQTYFEDGYLRSFTLRLTVTASNRSFIHRLAFTSQRRTLYEAITGVARQYHIFSCQLLQRDVQNVGRQDIATALAAQRFHEALPSRWSTPLFRF